MNFSVPSSEQVTSGFSGSSTTLSRAPGFAQSSASNCAATSSVTHARSLSSLGLAWPAGAEVVGDGFGVAVVVADGDGVVLPFSSACGSPLLAVGVAPVTVGTGAFVVADPVGVPAGVPVGVPVGCGWLVPAAAARTGRKRICDDFRMASSVCFVGWPGMLTTMLRPPRVVTSAPATPLASTRCTMMSRAWSSCSLVTVLEPTRTGSRTIWVPPSRSSPSFGAYEPVPKMFAPTRRPARIAVIAASEARTFSGRRACGFSATSSPYSPEPAAGAWGAGTFMPIARRS